MSKRPAETTAGPAPWKRPAQHFLFAEQQAVVKRLNDEIATNLGRLQSASTQIELLTKELIEAGWTEKAIDEYVVRMNIAATPADPNAAPKVAEGSRRKAEAKGAAAASLKAARAGKALAEPKKAEAIAKATKSSLEDVPEPSKEPWAEQSQEQADAGNKAPESYSAIAGSKDGSKAGATSAGGPPSVQAAPAEGSTVPKEKKQRRPASETGCREHWVIGKCQKMKCAFSYLWHDSIRHSRSFIEAEKNGTLPAHTLAKLRLVRDRESASESHTILRKPLPTEGAEKMEAD